MSGISVSTLSRHVALAVASGLTLLALAACDQGEADTKAAPPPPSVTVANPLVKPIVEWDEFTGRFEAVQSVDVRARVTGYLDSVNFTDGQVVEQGQILFVIDPRPFQATLDSSKAQLDSAKATAQLAVLDLERAAALVSTSAVSKQVLDQRKQEKEAADAAVEVADAAVTQAQLNLDYSTIRAPLKGRISRRLVDVGNLIVGDSSGTPLTNIVQLDPIYFGIDMSESDYLAYKRAIDAGKLTANIEDGADIFVRLVDEEGWPHPGHIDFLDNQVNADSGTIRARAILPNPSGIAAPGLFGRLRLPGSNQYDAILVPDEAIVTDQARKILLTVAADGTVGAKEVRPGPMVDGLRVIRSGIEPGDSIIINGLLRARPGGKVTPQQGKIEATDPTAG